MEIAVGDFVTQILGHAITPVRKDRQPGVALEEKRAATWQTGVCTLYELAIRFRFIEQIKMNRLV